ncbi:hypothetical protein D9M69_383920 [compost metagenome]
MEGGLHVKWADRGSAGAGNVAEQDPVLHVAAVQAARFEHAQQLRGEEIHLLPEVVVVLGVAEVVVARRVFVVVGERDAGDDQVHRVLGHRLGFQDAVVVRHTEMLAADLDALDANGAGEDVLHGQAVQPMLADNLGHVGHHMVVLGPFLLQGAKDFALSLGVDDVNLHRVALEEALDPVYGLNEVVELETDADEHRLVAVPLEVAAAAGNHRLGAEVLELAVAEIDDGLFALVQILAAVDADRLRQGLLDGVALIFEVMPEDVVAVRVVLQDGHHLRDPSIQAVALLRAGLLHAQGSITEQQALAILFGTGRRMVGRYLVVDHPQFRQFVAFITEPEVRGSLQEDRPAVKPEPELALLVRVQGQVVGLGAVALEEAGQRLAGVHDAEEAGVVDQLLVAVRAGRGGGDEAVPDAAEQTQEGLIGLGAEAAQHARFVQADGGEQRRVKLAVTDRLVVGQVEDLAVLHLIRRADELELDAEHGAVAAELLAHAQRQADQYRATGKLLDQAQDLDLHHRLAQAEGGEDGPAAAAHRPAHDGALVRLEDRVDVVVAHVEAGEIRQANLLAQEVEIGSHAFSRSSDAVPLVRLAGVILCFVTGLRDRSRYGVTT